MSIDPTKFAGSFRISPAQKRAGDISIQKKQLFDQLLDGVSNSVKDLENSDHNGTDFVRLAQLQMLQGLFSLADNPVEDDIFSGLRQVMRSNHYTALQSQIVDKYSKSQQLSLLKPEPPKGQSDLDQMIDQVAKRVSLSPELIHSVVSAESAYNPEAVSAVGAQGLMQLMPETADELGVKDSFDPHQNLLGGSKYLKQLLDKYDGDLDHALAAYNWGQGNVDRHGLENLPDETRKYIAKIKGLLATSRV